jgi:hypothetical protein
VNSEAHVNLINCLHTLTGHCAARDCSTRHVQDGDGACTEIVWRMYGRMCMLSGTVMW